MKTFIIILPYLLVAVMASSCTDRGPQEESRYLVFKDRREIGQWYEDRRLAMRAVGRDMGEPYPFTHIYYDQAEKVVSFLWPYFEKRYPEALRGLPEPSLLIFKTGLANAFTAHDDVLGKIPHAFLLHDGLLQAKVGRALPFVLAHEMAHHALGHTLPGEAARKRHSFRVGPEVRTRTIEDEADEIATLILREARLDPLAADDFFLSLMSDAAKEFCRLTIDEQRVPYFGTLGEDHHAPCFRMYHIRRYLETLDQVRS
jgi:hypothetical protein